MRSIKLISERELIRNISSEPNNSVNKKRQFLSSLLIYILPAFVFAIIIILNANISTFTEYSLILVSIFTGLLFSFLLSVGEKVKMQKDNPNRDNDQFQNYKRLINQLSKIAQFEIILGIKYIAIVIITSLTIKLLPSDPYYVNTILGGVSVFLLTQFIAILYYVWFKLYYVLEDDINNTL